MVRKHWINNSLAQASIVFMLGIAFLATGLSQQLGYMLAIPLSMVVGMIITTYKPEPF